VAADDRNCGVARVKALGVGDKFVGPHNVLGPGGGGGGGD
jgi:hypothetical protein